MCYTNECCGGEGAPCYEPPPPKDEDIVWTNIEAGLKQVRAMSDYWVNQEGLPF